MCEVIGAATSSFRGKAKDSGLNSDTLVVFLQKFPEVSAEWLMRDEGPMLRADIVASEQNVNNGVNIGRIGSEHVSTPPDELPDSDRSKASPCATCENGATCIFLQAKQEVIDAQHVTINALQAQQKLDEIIAKFRTC
ncbi:MAG: hypothetical protein IJT12_09140 [Paludibacteraceae bacterium]|nr:hypothetical protein [Paludibacteraceae bacterium]